MQTASRQWLKLMIGFAVCFGIRLLPWKAPNVEPILATTMPFARVWGWLPAFLFGFLSILLFDSVTSGIGSWTWWTAAAYGVIGGCAAPFLRRVRGIPGYLLWAIIGTLLYDGFTGLTLGPLLWGQPFQEAFFGQIPFTINHLIGNIVLSLTLSPLLERWVLRNDRLEWALRLGNKPA